MSLRQSEAEALYNIKTAIEEYLAVAKDAGMTVEEFKRLL
jgi:predicted RNase H-like HicB family nuclease